jgi:hypothetical protein
MTLIVLLGSSSFLEMELECEILIGLEYFTMIPISQRGILPVVSAISPTFLRVQ